MQKHQKFVIFAVRARFNRVSSFPVIESNRGRSSSNYTLSQLPNRLKNNVSALSKKFNTSTSRRQSITRGDGGRRRRDSGRGTKASWTGIHQIHQT